MAIFSPHYNIESIIIILNPLCILLKLSIAIIKVGNFVGLFLVHFIQISLEIMLIIRFYIEIMTFISGDLDSFLSISSEFIY